jgi:energy-coupling factor transport system ATP-binding protein
MDRGEVKLAGTPREVFRQRENIIKLGLNFPVTVQLAAGLRKKGFAIPEDVIDTEELINSLCRL